MNWFCSDCGMSESNNTKIELTIVPSGALLCKDCWLAYKKEGWVK